MKELTVYEKRQELVRSIRIECAEAICNACRSSHPEPLDDAIGYGHVVSAGCAISSVRCFASPIWDLINSSSTLEN